MPRPTRTRSRRPAYVVALLPALLSGAVVSAPTSAAAPESGTANAASVAPAADPAVRVTAPTVTNGFNQPTGVYAAKDGSNRLFILEKAGRVRVFDQDTTVRSTFVDLTDRVSSEGERGLLGLAFDPAFATNGFVYLAFTTADAQLQVTRFQTFNRLGSGMALNKATGTRLLTVPHPTSTSNHYAGHLAFGPDKLLYISTGDGATLATRNAAQAPSNLYGKILRIDPSKPSAGLAYSIPPTNPYATNGQGRREVFLRGLRNPFAFSVDDNGDVYIGDVGQSTQEEVTRVSPGDGLPDNLGWPCLEGTSVLDASQCTAALGSRRKPITTYGRAVGRSVTGGLVYHGTRYPALDGLYVFGDFATGEVFLLDPRTGTRTSKGQLLPLVTGFGESDSRELYAVTITGELHAIQAR